MYSGLVLTHILKYTHISLIAWINQIRSVDTWEERKICNGLKNNINQTRTDFSLTQVDVWINTVIIHGTSELLMFPGVKPEEYKHPREKKSVLHKGTISNIYLETQGSLLGECSCRLYLLATKQSVYLMLCATAMKGKLPTWLLRVGIKLRLWAF